MTSPYSTTKIVERNRRRRGKNEAITVNGTNVDRLGSESVGTMKNFVFPINPTIAKANDSTNVKNSKTMVKSMGETFAVCYMELCRQQRVRPLPIICVTLPHSLDLTTDRVKMDDWGPILNSLSIDRTLKSVSVRSRHDRRKIVDDRRDDPETGKTIGKRHEKPAVLTRYLLEWLSHSVAQCVTNSRSLTRLELEGVGFPSDCLSALCVGLSGTSSLRHLSLRRCRIGDDGCELVCRTIAAVGTLRCLDLSECDLSVKCARALASALSRQKLELYHETWKESLRYGEPDLEAMPGLRRLTLNGNNRFGDRGVFELLDAIRDSLWLKALDLQNCGLTDTIGSEIINILKNNDTLIIVDVRMNAAMSEENLRLIVRGLEINGGATTKNGKSSYAWMSLNRNDRRNVVSAGGIRKNRCDNISKNLSEVVPRSRRPKSAYVPRNITKNGVVNDAIGVERKNSEKSVVPRTIGTTPATTKKHANDDDADERSAKIQNPKMSIRVDLRSTIESIVETATPEPEPSENAEVKDKMANENVQDRGVAGETGRSDNDDEVSKILRELSEARAEHDRLVEETKRTDVLLAEEIVRRENAESKLRRTRDNLTDLETALRKKEHETRGFLLISQRSLDEIATSFERLLAMLERSTTMRPTFRADGEDVPTSSMIDDTRPNDNEYSIARAELRTRVARLIRKTKSESDGRRGFRIECERSSIVEASSARKFARSEADVTDGTSLPFVVRPVRLERNIGDSPDVVSSRMRDDRSSVDRREITSDKRDNYEKISDACAPCERARAIFARIVNGNAIVRPHDDHGG